MSDLASEPPPDGDSAKAMTAGPAGGGGGGGGAEAAPVLGAVAAPAPAILPAATNRAAVACLCPPPVIAVKKGRGTHQQQMKCEAPTQHGMPPCPSGGPAPIIPGPHVAAAGPAPAAAAEGAPAAAPLTATAASTAADGEEEDTVRAQLFRGDRRLQRLVLVTDRPLREAVALPLPYSGPRFARLNRKVVRTFAAAIPPSVTATATTTTTATPPVASTAATGGSDGSPTVATAALVEPPPSAAATVAEALACGVQDPGVAVRHVASVSALHALLHQEILSLWRLPDVCTGEASLQLAFGFCFLAAAGPQRFHKYQIETGRRGGRSAEEGSNKADDESGSDGGEEDEEVAVEALSPVRHTHSGTGFASLERVKDDVASGSLQCHFVPDTPIQARLVFRVLPFDEESTCYQRRAIVRIYSKEKLGYMVVRAALPTVKAGDRGGEADGALAVTDVETTGLRFAWTAVAFPASSDPIGWGPDNATRHAFSFELAFHSFFRKPSLLHAEPYVMQVLSHLTTSARDADVTQCPVPSALVGSKECEFALASIRIEDVIIRTIQGLVVEQCESAVWEFSVLSESSSARLFSNGGLLASGDDRVLTANNAFKLRESRIHWPMPTFNTNEANLENLKVAMDLAEHVVRDGNAGHRHFGAAAAASATVGHAAADVDRPAERRHHRGGQGGRGRGRGRGQCSRRGEDFRDEPTIPEWALD